MGVAFDGSFTILGTLRLAPLRALGVQRALLKALRKLAQEDYDKVVSTWGFDPLARIDGVVVAAMAPDVGRLSESSFTLVAVNVNGIVSDPLLQTLIKRQPAASLEVGPRQNLHIALLTPLTSGQITLLADGMAGDRRARGAQVVRETPAADRALVLYHHLSLGVGYVYVWPGGMVVGQLAEPMPSLDADAVKSVCTNVLKILDSAAQLRVVTAEAPVMQVRAPIERLGVLRASAWLGADVEVKALLDVSDDDVLAQLKKFATDFKVAQQVPDQVIQKLALGERLEPLMRLLIKNTTLSVTERQAALVFRASALALAGVLSR